MSGSPESESNPTPALELIDIKDGKLREGVTLPLGPLRLMDLSGGSIDKARAIIDEIFAKAGILSGVFYIQAALLFATALVMCLAPAWQHVIFGLVSAACFFVPGLKYARQRGRGE